MLAGRIIALIICAAALIVTFRTENILKAFFRVNNAGKTLILKTKTITLCIAAALFIAALLIF